MKHKTLYFLLTFVFLLGLSACSAAENGSTGLTASGAIAADQIRVAPEISGKVLSINVTEGDTIQAGDVLFTLDDELMQAQAAQAQAAVDLAAVSVEAANAQLSGAQVQYEVVVQQTRLASLQNRATSWMAASPEAFELPVWYFEKSELITAAQAEVDAAALDLETELSNLEKELNDASNVELLAVEIRLADAQIVYAIADQTLKQAQAAADKETLEPAAQEALDAAKSELDDAQLDYDRMLSTSAAEAVLEARARVAVARARLDNALDTLTSLQTGEESLQAQAAQTAVSQAETAVAQANANLVQAQAALNLVNLTLQRSTVTAPANGTVLSLNIEVGELLSAGSVALTIGQLDQVNLTVYVPEDQYGKINIGQQVSVLVDSYPGQVFSGQVDYISDEAEFTPRNVQTVEGRKSTVYAVKITLENADLALKPGMPADVDFNLP